jgi:hypothetical protein
MAQQCGGSGEPACPSGNVSGTVSIGTSLTLTLASNSFTLAATPGQTSTTTPIAATVETNDTGGYYVTQALGEDMSGAYSGNYGFYPATQCATCGIYDATTISPYIYPGGPTSTPAFNTFSANGTGPSALTQTAISAGPSAASGDVYNLEYQFATPGNAAPQTDTGSITVMLIGN